MLTEQIEFKMERLKTLVLSVLLLFALFEVKAQEKYQFTVAQDGTGDFTSIQKAINACKAYPDQRVTLFVKNGTYKEKILVPACNTRLSIVGESADKTILTFDDYFDKINRGRNSTFYTYTLLVLANDFSMENITIENSAGPVGQAIALYVEGDRCTFRNCLILGNQDTLLASGMFCRQYFENCTIEGTTDFIFGEATTLFENCTIYCKTDSYITAASTPEGKPFGFVFRNCKITASENAKKVYLGRPWRIYAKVAFLNCEMGSFILPEGWHNWSKPESEKTTVFAESGNTGAGADNKNRVSWSHQLSKKDAADYTKERIFIPLGWERISESKWYDQQSQIK
jgi:pectinesterase